MQDPFTAQVPAVQAPLTQVEPAAQVTHALPLMAHWFQVAGVIQPPVPVQQPFGQDEALQATLVQPPLTQICAAAQAWPQMPQLLLLVFVSTQPISPPQLIWPLGHTQVPLEQVAPGAH